jgi:H+-transporting ATPase
MLIAASLAIGGIAMTALPAFVVAGTLAAALLLAGVMATVKGPLFARLGVA